MEADSSGSSAERRRSSAARLLIAAALLAAVGAASLTIDWLRSSTDDIVEHPGPAATDEQTQTEVVGQAKDIVAIAALEQPTAGYLLMSCKNRDDPPYQGTVYLNFVLPARVDADAYFRGVAAALVAHGWKEGPPPNQHLFGRNMSKDGVSALLYREENSATNGVARIHGQCRDTTDHRHDSTAWVDVTDRLR
ncbi:hypothetical protein GCM10009641_24550 [Mycobacterium cookii]|uniref:Lipoprotein LppJ n=1 Tax=Mycobacterium cookii TaxID=1775 RepID=A0A7I7KSP2_9MYCO|nr:hypothetical protein [Mycobacterium cookii]MCV7331093.1 hypothetical protein [Mycobacterium cookii]BBX44953.1 hypothetical protein MCOO_09680 [Mycobacterium cookii]